jgi:hypothetical protein
MSKVKRMPGFAWLIIGVLVTLLVIPTTAYATGKLKFTGIEGTSTNKVDVTPAGQLLSSAADPNNLYQSGGNLTDVSSGDSPFAVATPASDSALIITSLTMDVFSVSTPGADNVAIFDVLAGSCTGDRVGSWETDVNPSTIGLTDIPLGSGFAVPSGDVLCVTVNGTPEFDVWAAGYSVPSSAVAAEAEHPAAATVQQP